MSVGLSDEHLLPTVNTSHTATSCHKHQSMLLVVYSLDHCRIVVSVLAAEDTRLLLPWLAPILLLLLLLRILLYRLRVLLMNLGLRCIESTTLRIRKLSVIELLLLGSCLFFLKVLRSHFSYVRRKLICWNIVQLLMMNEDFRRQPFEDPSMS